MMHRRHLFLSAALATSGMGTASHAQDAPSYANPHADEPIGQVEADLRRRPHAGPRGLDVPQHRPALPHPHRGGGRGAQAAAGVGARPRPRRGRDRRRDLRPRRLPGARSGHGHDRAQGRRGGVRDLPARQRARHAVDVDVGGQVDHLDAGGRRHRRRPHREPGRRGGGLRARARGQRLRGRLDPRCPADGLGGGVGRDLHRPRLRPPRPAARADRAGARRADGGDGGAAARG